MFEISGKRKNKQIEKKQMIRDARNQWEIGKIIKLRRKKSLSMVEISRK
jgi:hypothetical protein